MIESILNGFSTHPEWLGIGIAVIACIESLFMIGVIVPGVAILFAAGALAGNLEMPILPLLLWGACGAIVGDVTSYFIGRGIDRSVHDRPFMQRHREQWLKAHRFFERWGIVSVIVGRFIGALRPIMPAIAGMAGMSRRKFILVDFLSALAWAPAYLLPGYYSGSALLG